MDTSNIDKYMPTAETLRKEFFGIPYEKIPLVFIKASKNNTIIDIKDSNVSFKLFDYYVFLVQANYVYFLSLRRI